MRPAVVHNPVRLAIVALLTLVVGSCGEDAPPAQPAPLAGQNLILLVVDSLRPDHLGCYGYDRPTSPAIDALARDGMQFDRAYANSSYGPQSISSLLSGRLPSSGGAIGLLEAAPSRQVATLPVVFRRAGFRTGLVSNQPFLSDRGFTRGFDDIQIDPTGAWSSDELVERALEYVDAGPGPFLLMTQFLDPHEPYTPDPELRQRFPPAPTDPSWSSAEVRQRLAEVGADRLRDDPSFQDLVARYDAEIAATDRAIGAFLDGLRSRGALQDTLLVITSSHGLELLEHGDLGHGWTVHEEVVRIPLILHAPGRIPAGRIDHPVALLDLLPTLSLAMGVPTNRRDLEGRPLLRAAGSTPRSVLFEPPAGAVLAELVIRERCIERAVIQGPWKLISSVQPVAVEQRLDVARGYEERVRLSTAGELELPGIWDQATRTRLFHLQRDPGELTDLGDTETGTLGDLGRILERYGRFCSKNALTPRATRPVSELTPDERQRLEALGYL